MKADACDSHLRENPTGVICEYSESSITYIDQRIRPTVVRVGANVTLEDDEDTLHQVVRKAQQLFACPVSEYAGNRIQDSDSHSDTDINFR